MSPKCDAHAAIRKSASCWELPPGRALGFRADKLILLHMECGHAWITLGESDGGRPSASGDWFLDPGETLLIQAGAQVVMEADTSRNGAMPVRIQWSEPAAASPGRFAREVMAPAGEVVSALKHAGAALTRVFIGLLGFLGSGTTTRDALVPCLETTPIWVREDGQTGCLS